MLQALSHPSRTAQHPFQHAWIAMLRRLLATKSEPRDDTAAVLHDAHLSMRCGNPVRSWRVLSEWLKARGDQPEDYGWLSARLFNWANGRVIVQLTEARIARLMVLRRSTEALSVATQRLSVDPHFRLSCAADTLSLAQIAARSGAPRISRILLSDFGTRFAGDPRVSVSEALKRRLAQQTPAGMRAKAG